MVFHAKDNITLSFFVFVFFFFENWKIIILISYNIMQVS